LQLGLKDVNLALQQAETVQLPLELGQLMQKRMNRCVEKGFANHDWGAVLLDVKSLEKI
jgi:3-hydroxyisobutyrate dehydrogenase-like beta-hydroxyacid dehydrogenase